MAKKTAKSAKQQESKRLVLLDSHALLHSAYHALPDFSNSKGEPTGALFGLISRVLKITADLKPDYLIAARDLPGPTHRHKAFEEYKGTRAEIDEALIVQLKRAPDVFKAFGIPVYSSEGFEADDVIGTIVEEMKKQKNLEIIIVTGDMDLFQLISPQTSIYKTGFSLTDLKLYDEAAVEAKYGFTPAQVTDYKGIVGDQSDNIPGVPGVGEVTAKKLLVKYGTLDRVYTTLKKQGVEEVATETGLRKSYLQLILDNEKGALFSKELATIHLGAPIDFTLPPKHWSVAGHEETIAALCDELEFKTLKQRALATASHGTEETPEAATPSASVADVDPYALAETSVALWLLHSDTTNPSLEDIFAYAHTDDFEKARTHIFAELAKAGRLQKVFDDIEKPLIAIVMRMNVDGIAIDVSHFKSLAKEYSKELGAIAGRIYRHAGREFNINSPKQLGTVLFDELKIIPEKQKKTATGARTTKESELEKLSDMHPIIADILSYRELQKLLSTYVEKIPALVGGDGRLHAQFLQAGTTTGRMSSQDPNLQNIPVKTEYGRRIREAFAAPKGKMLAALDYSQIELRIAAGLSGDEKLIKVFKDGGDVHAAVASEVFGVPPEKVDYEMRRRAKVINFGILYGMGVNALRANLGAGVSREEAAKFLDAYFAKFAGLRAYIDRTKASAAKNGYTETLFGRRRYFSGFKSSLPGLRAQAERMATNAPIQGTQSDIIKLAMIEADALIEKNGWRERVKLVLQVHDELVYEIDAGLAEEAARTIRAIMEGVVPKDTLAGVPILAEIAVGKNWGYMTKLKR